MEIDISRSCRSCLSQSNFMHPICESAKCSVAKDFNVCNMSIAEVIMTCTNVNISPNDGLPQSVCSECLEQIQQAFHFKEKCEAADLKLRQYSLDTTDPISCIKTEDYENDVLFHPETVLVTEFGIDTEFDTEFKDEPNVANNYDRPVIKREKKQQKESVEKIASKIKIEQILTDIDEKTLIEEALIVDGRFQCKFCEKSLADRHTFKLHIRLHTGTNLQRCAICDRGFAKKNYLERHLATHEETLKCSYCTKAFITIGERKIHLMTCPKSNRKELKEEDVTFVPKRRLSESRDDETEEEQGERDGEISDPDYMNENDEKVANRKSTAKKNVRVEDIPKRTNDDHPKASKWTRIPLDTEELRLVKSAKIVDDRYECPLCLKTLARREILILHIRTHTGKNLLQCSVCEKGFAKPYNLKRHMLLHDDNNTTTDETVSETQQLDDTEIVHSTKTEKLLEAGQLRPPKEAWNDTDDEDERLANSAESVDGRYRCIFCDKTLANRGTLKLHLRLHLKKKLKICEECGHGFSKNSHLDRHMKTHLPKAHTAVSHKEDISLQKVKTAIVPWTQPTGKKVCQCMICDSVFDEILALRNHLSWHTNTTDWMREVDFKSKVELLGMFNEFRNDELTNEDIAKVLQTKLKCDSPDVLKMYRITNDKGWEQSLTDSDTESESNDDSEQKRIYDCNECSRSFDRLYKVMCHLKEDHDSSSKEFQCNCCSQDFPNSTVLAKHLRQQCGNEFKMLKCTLCYNRFTWQSSLASHFSVYHQNDSTHTCDVCSKSFNTKQRLNDHRRTHVPRDKRFACDVCEKKFSRFDNMRTHMRSHIPPQEREVIAKTHLCSYCGQGFRNSSALNVHVRTHTGEKPFKCDLCSAKFRRSTDLNCHRRTHTGEKPYPCLVCGRRFSRSNKLVRHMRIHTGERPYKCTECDRAFTQSNDLTLHLRRHTGEKPFNCTCGERFITNSLLQQHRRAHAHQ